MLRYKPYIDMNTDLKKKAKNDFEKGFFKLMNNVRKHRGIKLVGLRERRRNYLVSELNYHSTKFSTEYLLATELKKNADTYEQTCLFRTFNTRIKYNIKV